MNLYLYFIREKERTKKDKHKISIKDLFRYSSCFDKFLITIGFIVSVVAGSIYPSIYAIYGHNAQVLVNYKKSQVLLNSTIDTYVTNSSDSKCSPVNFTSYNYDEQIDLSVALFLSFGFVSLILNYMNCFIWSLYGARQTKRIRTMLFESLLRKQIQFYDKYTPGELNGKINNNLKAYSVGIGDRFGDAISQFVKFVVFVILSFVYSAYMGLVYLPIVVLISALAAIMFVFYKKYTFEETRIYEIAGNIAQQALSGLRTVFAFGLQKRFINKYDVNLKDLVAIAVKKSVFMSLFLGFAEFFLYSIFGVSTIFGVFLLQSQCAIFGDLAVATFSMWNSTFSLGQSLSFLSDFSQALSAAEILFGILDYESVIDSSKNTGHKLEKINGEIELTNVHFSYPQRPETKILNNISLKIEAGKTVAICGGSGGGKSTIIQLIQRFYDPNEGQVTLDGHNLKDLNINWLRGQMALVSQEPVLFATTIRENIRMGLLNATNEECEEAAKQANIHSFIMSLKDGYDTYVGERGSQLSGGQKQRISIARALVRNPKILLLDEATSALDFESEKEVQEALDSAKIGRTTIIVAHRLSTIRNADLILVLKNGNVYEMGTHNELISKRGFYYKLNSESMKQIEQNESHVETFDEDDADETFTETSNHNLIKSVDRSYFDQFKEIMTVQKFLWVNQKSDIVYLLIGIICQLLNGASNVAVVFLAVESFNIAALLDLEVQRNQSYLFSGLIFAVSLVILLTNLISSFSFSVCGARLTKRLRVKMFESLLRQEVGWHDLNKNQSSILCMKLENSVLLCKGATTDVLSILSRAISGVGVAIIVSFVLNWKLTLVLSVFVPIIFMNGVVYGQMKYHSSSFSKNDIQSGKMLIDCIDQIRTIVSLGREEYFINKFKSIFQNKSPLKSFETYKRATFYTLSISLYFFTMATNFKFGFYLLKNNEIEMIDMYRIYEIIVLLTIILGRDASLLTSTPKALKGAKNAFKIITRSSLIDSLDNKGKEIENLKGEIEFHDVHFKYPTRQTKILNGLSLKINYNDMTGIVGRSGCGKSTIIQLLLRFYDVDEGKITIDGVDIRDLNINWLRSQIGLVSQEPVLFDTTISENIMLGCFTDANRRISENDLIEVSKKANIHERIESFPEKYETNVGHKGFKISVGEKQRIAIARALIREPRILLLDEATSSLDTESERLVQIGLDNARLNRTCICIAHRLLTIEESAKISVFENGRVLEEGTHEELMKNGKLYLKFQKSNSIF